MSTLGDDLSGKTTCQPALPLAGLSRNHCDPTRANAYAGRANTLNTLGRYEEALEDYNKALEIDPSLANAYVNRGSAYSHLGQYKKAIADYEKIISDLNGKDIPLAIYLTVEKHQVLIAKTPGFVNF